jgi:hypothetical protein
MNSQSELKIDWATHDAAVYACRNWHYSKCIPVFKCVRVGVWEKNRFIGVVLFGQGATPEIGSPYGLAQTEICELTRIALTKHQTPVSRIMAIAIKFLKRHCPKLRLIVSFADQSQNHHGGIYQATNWIYAGGSETHAYEVNGQRFHPKTLHSKYGKGGQSIPWLKANVDRSARRIVAGFKHRYLMPLDEAMRQQIEPLRKPYPKRVRSVDSDTSGGQPEVGGANPTRTLSNSVASQRGDK